MKKITLLLLFFLMASWSSAQKWGANTESEFTNEAMDVETDAIGNSYVCGYITGQTAFDINNVAQISQGNGEIYVSKYSPTGNLIWTKYFGGNLSDRAVDLTLDQNSNIYVTGEFYGQANFDSFSVTSTSNSKDIFILKMNNQGDVQWVRKEGGADAENAYGITTDSQGNVIITGQFSGNSTIGGQNFVSYIDPITNLSSFDLFVSKYDTNGNPLWVQVGQADYEERGLAVQVDSQDNIFISGQFSDTMIFAGQTIYNNAYNVGFLAKLQSNGQFVFLNKMFGGMIIAYDLELNDLDEVVVVGDFLGTFIYLDGNGNHQVSNQYQRKVFSILVQNNGDYIWGTAIGSDNELSARSVSISASKDIYITGYFSCALSEFHENHTAVFNSVGYKDAYLWKVTYQGNHDFIKQFGSKKDDVGHGVAIQNSYIPIICGGYTEDLNIYQNPLIPYTVSQTSNFNFLFGPTNEFNHVFLSGDASRNSFLLNAVDSYTPDYNFFDEFPFTVDSLYGFLYAETDTSYGCINDLLVYETQTFPHAGPDYNFLWNTGATTQSINAYGTGTYTISIERKDGCSMGEDTIIVYPLPNLPTMTDDLGLAVQEPGSMYYEYFFCYPDSVNIWFNDLDSGNTITISNNSNVFITDTLSHLYTQAGVYNVLIEDSLCKNHGSFKINFDYAIPHDIVPYIVMVDVIDYNDSISVCDDQFVEFQLLDSLENPNGTFGFFPSDPVVQEYWTISPSAINSIDTFQSVTQPTVSGWYHVTHTGIYGYDNLCGVDTSIITVSDSFYIEVLPTPNGTTSISGDLLCPNGSVYLTLSNVIPGLSWSGPGINWVSSNGDSIQATVAGVYVYSGTLIDSVNGCSKSLSFSYTLYEKQPPAIQSNPSDAIICPNDSVYMWVDSSYVSYSWEGPSGNNLSSTYDYTDSIQGFYFCVVEDAEGCILTTPPLEIREFTTPYIVVEPSNILCEGDTVEIQVIAEGNANFQWTSPISSNVQTIYASQPGWYVCEIQQCGITTIDSVEIIDGTFTATISASDTLLCYQEVAVLYSNPGMSFYEWSSGEFGSPMITTQTAGDFAVEVVNQYGCTDVSDTIHIEQVEGSEPPQIASVSICSGEDVIFSDNTLNTTNWYDLDTNLILTGSNLQNNNVLTDTSFLVAYDAQPLCENVYSTVSITVVDSLASYSIIGDSSLCLNNQIILTTDALNETIEWFVNSSYLNNSDSITLDGANLNDTNLIQLIVSNQCFTDTISQEVFVFVPQLVNILEDSIIVCQDEILTLTTETPIDLTTWSGEFGTITQDTLTYNFTTDAFVYVSGVDSNFCFTNSDSVYITISQLNYGLYDNFGLNCEGSDVIFGVQSPSDSMIWSGPNGFVSTNNEIQFTLDTNLIGTYSLIIWDENGCSYEDSILLDVNVNPLIDLDIDSVICARTYISIMDNDSVDYSFYGFNNVDSILIAYSQEVIITAQSSSGCTTMDTIQVDVVDCEDELPNVITANGDGVNDYFIIDEAPLYPNNRLIIVNRWGNVVFDESGYLNTFNGGELSDGVYFYTFYYDYEGNREHQRTGFITLVR